MDAELGWSDCKRSDALNVYVVDGKRSQFECKCRVLVANRSASNIFKRGNTISHKNGLIYRTRFNVGRAVRRKEEQFGSDFPRVNLKSVEF